MFQIKLDLVFDQTYHFVDDVVAGHFKVFGCRVVAFDKTRDRLGEERLAPTRILHEVEEENFIEVRVHLVVIVEVDVIM